MRPLTGHGRPGTAIQREDLVGEPQVEIEAQRRAFAGREGGQAAYPLGKWGFFRDLVLGA